MRPEILYPLFMSIEKISGIGQKYGKLFALLCGNNRFIDVLFHFPYNIINRSNICDINNAPIGQISTIKAKVIEHIAPKNKKQPYKILLEDKSGQLLLYFFKYYPSSLNKNYPLNYEIAVSGKIEEFNGLRQMIHPDCVVMAEDIKKIARIEPVYLLTAGLNGKLIEKVVKYALPIIPQLKEWQDMNFVQQQNFPSFVEALRLFHNPVNIESISKNSPAYRRLAYDELLANQLALVISRTKIKKQKGFVISGDGSLRQQLLKTLPFELTDAQNKALEEIYNDQKSNFKMLRLLQGDVGCGKTIVALLAMLNTKEAGFQSAIMAPTEILAMQHFETFNTICKKLNLNIELLTGRIKGKKREQILENLKSGKIDILVGTHALFTDDVVFENLGLAVIDEQHRFGVHQRLALSSKEKKCDVLVMTATPIPRTLVLTSYGDMEYSQIAELPKGRKPVETLVMPSQKITEIVTALQRKIADGVRAYWVCPLIDESEKSDLAAAIARYNELQKIFDNKVGLIHGKMKDAEKDEIMQKFKSGNISLLVSTTVIEVGVNVPEATIMIIEGAQRFGLAQLHQLRGRIKRANHASTCILCYDTPLSQIGRDRLEIMKQTEDGFLIAEEDLRLRGGGEILGSKQSGFEIFKIASLPLHNDLLLTANKDAKMIMQNDENLSSERGLALRNLLYLFEKDEDLQTYKAG